MVVTREDAIAAAKHGNVDILSRWATTASTEINQYDNQGWTPLLWASARGHADAIKVLLNAGADPGVAHRNSGALPVHLAAQSGDVPSVRILLESRPEHLNAVYDINGHTPLLQAVFYGHLPLTDFLLQRGADTSIPTARGLGPLELAEQFQNHEMARILRPYDSPAEAKAAAYRAYLTRIAPTVPSGEQEMQALSDRLVDVISDGLRDAAAEEDAADRTLRTVQNLIESQGADVNRLGGPLQEPPLIVAVTGGNGTPANPRVATLREMLARYLLDHGADPIQHEIHPMGVQSIIRAAVFNHLTILRMCAEYLTETQLADAINEWPLVNGLTAMHDTVLRAIMADQDRFQGYLDQARWFAEHGGRSDIEDYSGQTQRELAATAADQTVRQRLLDVLDGNEGES